MLASSQGRPESLLFTLQTLEENMRDGVVSNSLVAFLRMLTSCEIELKSDFFAPFIMVRLLGPAAWRG